MNKIQFSVVIPLYNKIDSVTKTLESISAQRYAAAEIIVVDDGSSDGSAEKVRELNMPNLRIVEQTNQGVSAARNLGVSLASFPYIAFLDADDQWSPFFLAEMHNLILRFPEQSFFASHYQKVVKQDIYIDPKLAIKNVSPTGCILENYFAVASNGDLPFMVSSCVITSYLFDQLGGFPIGESMGEDQELFCRVALQSQIVFSPLVLLLYHTDAENRACDRHIPQRILPFAARLLEKTLTPSIDTELKRDILRYCGAHVCHLVRLNIRAGDFIVAKRLLKMDVCKLKPMHKLVFYLWTELCICHSLINGLFKWIRRSFNINSKS
ncbi:glycosyltransferase family 2 protein [Brumicola pallidula]|uniref:Glycosyl transferase, group 2 family protein n=1 Tax=Brumicola pallidula DSM 14239 = ACAM 615 TaxID=1121922 RepID=K6Y2J8_9ALTE|nr:glycosyltransferase family 2 protein [Glaciecola pallidula]GAC27054.1 glycosyl transferase, group 2 family protein [Glaciecola pallidula DSM 14239 = ACAM 615]